MDYLLKPWEHQLRAIEAARSSDCFALFFEVGTGKTGTTINILRHKYQQHGRVLKTLILSPLITLENWKREFQLHSKLKPEQVVILKGTKVQRKATFHVAHQVNEGNFVAIINYEALVVMPELFEELLAWGPEVLVCDESHKVKDMKSKRTKNVIKLADVAKYRYILTGTPFLNSEMDIFSQYRILDKGETFSTKFFVFRDTYFYDKNARMPKDRYFPNWAVRPGSYEKLTLKIYKKAMRVTKEECLDLPDFVRTKIEIELSPEQKKHYEEMKNDFITFINDQAVASPLAITKALRLQQIASGYIPVSQDSLVKFKDIPRLSALKDLLESLTPNHKVIVWAVFKENYEQVRSVCEELKIGYVECHGEISNAQKFNNVDRFTNDAGCRVFIGNPSSAGVGINLTASTYNISYSRNFSLGDYIQAQGRSHRGGQTQKVTWVDIVAKGTIDELVLEALENKEEIGLKILKMLAKKEDTEDKE